MTRSHKFNEKDHSGEGVQEEHLPKFFAKSGFVDTDPKKVKKEGGGKGNWGREGDELQDYAVNMANPRRRSNSNSHTKGAKDFKTKFEEIEPEPVFEESIHGPGADAVVDAVPNPEHVELEHQSTTSSDASAGSVEEVEK